MNKCEIDQDNNWRLIGEPQRQDVNKCEIDQDINWRLIGEPQRQDRLGITTSFALSIAHRALNYGFWLDGVDWRR